MKGQLTGSRNGRAVADSVKAAESAGLKYVNAGESGIWRRRNGRGYVYEDSRGRRVTDPKVLDRIRSLAIPPAWEAVWICASADGHLQAVGQDAKGRRQYRYHEDYRLAQDCNKFNRIISFGAALPRMRRIVTRDLRRAGMPKRKVMALLVRLLDETCIRVGNSEYARSNESYGLTTFKDDHARIRGGTVQFKFRAKSGVEQELSLENPRLARLIKRSRDLPGEELFQYCGEDSQYRAVQSADVNEYIRQISGEEFTAKDFRTWHGTVRALMELSQIGPATSKADAKRRLSEAVKATARQLGNRPATCRSYYIHPAVLDSYLDQRLFRGEEGCSSPTLRSFEKTLLTLVKRIHRPRVKLNQPR